MLKNLQGDIVKILDEDGQEKASYVYNAWGNILSQSEDELSSINPLRYRGYVYDEDTTLYYLQSRYYDPTTGRFINADDTAYVDTNSGTPLSTNMFAYCENNYIISIDPSGNAPNRTRNLIKLLIKNAFITKIWKRIPIYGIFRFYNAVKNYGVWDYKRKGRAPSWAKSGKFYAFGRTMTTEQLGNLNFGFTGASMGFSPAILFAGGGFVAIKGGASWKDWKYFFDSRSDHRWIALGILAYSVFDFRYRLLNSAFMYAIKRSAYTLCLSIYKYFR